MGLKPSPLNEQETIEPHQLRCLDVTTTSSINYKKVRAQLIDSLGQFEVMVPYVVLNRADPKCLV